VPAGLERPAGSAGSLGHGADIGPFFPDLNRDEWLRAEGQDLSGQLLSHFYHEL